MTLRDILRLLRRRWWVLLLSVLVATGLGVGLAVARGTKWSARSTVLLSQPQVADVADTGLQTQEKLNLLAVTYAGMMATPKFLSDATSAAGIAQGDSSVSGTVVFNTPIVQLTVRSASADTAIGVARAESTALQQYLDASQSGVGQHLRITATLLEDPVATSSTTTPAFIIVAAAVAGLALGGTLVLLFDLK